VETILDPQRLAPLVKYASEVALRSPRIRSALARGETIVRAIRVNPAFKATLAGAGFVFTRLKASPSLSGLLASGLAVLIFVSASPLIFRTVAPTGKTEPAAVEAPALTPATPAPDTVPIPPAGAASGSAGQKSASSSGSQRSPATHTNPEPFIEHFIRLDESRWYVADRGPNGDWTANDFRRAQLSITHEGLNVTLARAPNGRAPPFTSGEISTLRKFRYGYFEARIRIPRGAGLDTGLFTYVRDKGPTGWNEIDIEFIGRNPQQVELTLHVGKQTAHRIVQLPFDPASGFHTYAFDWKPNSVTWYIDGREVHEEHGRVAAGLTRPQNFLFDLWGSETLPLWMGKIDPDGGPYVATISCFAYAKSYEGRALCDDAGKRKPEDSSRIGLK
jgi:endo-1,3-1,4-beta-glycanase ExoK